MCMYNLVNYFPDTFCKLDWPIVSNAYYLYKYRSIFFVHFNYSFSLMSYLLPYNVFATDNSRSPKNSFWLHFLAIRKIGSKITNKMIKCSHAVRA